MITQACTKNTPAEMYFGKDQKSDSALIGRFQGKTKDTFLLHLSSEHAGAEGIEIGSTFTTFFVANDEAFTFDGNISELTPNEEDPSIVTVEVTHGPVVPTQRRNAFRTTFDGFISIDVKLHTTQKTETDGPAEEIVAEGMIQGASALGLGIQLDGHVGKNHTPGTRVYATFETEIVKGPFTLLAELRHVREYTVTIYEGEEEHTEDKTTLGLELIEWPNQVDFGKEMARFERTVNHVQRERRKKMAA